MSIEHPIPPIIRDLLNKLHSLDVNERDNVVMTIEEIGRICTREAEQYRKRRAVDFEEDRRNKRKTSRR